MNGRIQGSVRKPTRNSWRDPPTPAHPREAALRRRYSSPLTPELGPAYSPQSLLSVSHTSSCLSLSDRCALCPCPCQSCLLPDALAPRRVEARAAPSGQTRGVTDRVLPPRQLPTPSWCSAQRAAASSHHTGRGGWKAPLPVGGSIENVPPTAAAYSSKDGGSNGWTRKPKQKWRR